MRELSIRLFQVMVGFTEGTTKKMMKQEVHDSSFTCMTRTWMRARWDSQPGQPFGQCSLDPSDVSP